MGRGTQQGAGHFTKCKIPNGNEALLHCGPRQAIEGGTTKVPVIIGRGFLKHRFHRVFKKVHDRFMAGVDDERGEANITVGCVLRGFGLRAGYHWVAHDH